MATHQAAYEQQLMDRINDRSARVVIIGIGYVGLPLAIAFAESGFVVHGLDINAERVARVNAGDSYIKDISSETLAAAIRRPSTGGYLEATTEFDVINDADVVIITVPTPLSKTRHPDLSHIVATVEQVATRVRPGMLVVLQSTTYPGTTHELVLPRLLEARQPAMTVGQDLFVAFAPERVDPGRTDWNIRNTPKVVGGETAACLRVASALFQAIVQTVVPVGSPAEAEMVKLLENTFRATNIALVNEVAIMCDRLGLNVWNVISAAATKPFGFMKFTPGPGIGGHCIPTDPQYLAWKLRSLNYEARFVGLAEEINLAMQDHVVEKVTLALNDAGKPVRGSRILCLGVAYKPDIGDIRESPALAVIHKLADRGADIAYHDPYVAHVNEDGLDMHSVDLDEHRLRETDCVVLLTAHSNFDWDWIMKHCRLVVDTRNATAGFENGSCRVVGI